MLKGWIGDSFGGFDFHIYEEEPPGCGCLISAIIFFCFITFVGGAIYGWPKLVSEGNFIELISIVTIIIISQIIGWVIDRKSKHPSIILGIVMSTIATGIIFLIFTIFTIIKFSEMYNWSGDLEVILYFIFGPFIVAGMAIAPSIIVGLVFYIYEKVKMKNNPLRLLIIDKVKSARSIDPDLAVYVNNDRVRINTKDEIFEIIFSEHGYVNIDDARKNILINDIIKSSLSNEYKLIGGEIVKAPKTSSDSNKHNKYKTW